MIPLHQPLRRSHSLDLRLLVVAARIVLFSLMIFHASQERHDHGSVVSAFRPQEQPRGKMSNRFRRCGFDRCHRFPTRTAGLLSSSAIGMFPPLPPSFEYDDAVVFVQRATKTRIVGKDKLERSIEQWGHDFRTEVDDGGYNYDGGGSDTKKDDDDDSMRLRFRSARLQTTVATTVSPTTLLVRWNLTYVDPSVSWLVSLSETIPGWTPVFRPYTDQASEVRKFSYSALGRLFADAFATGNLRVPLSCIEGTSTCEFREEKQQDERTKKSITSIAEDLAYAQDLNRGALSNRLCARDLQFFLEVARKPLEYRNDVRTNQGRASSNGNTADAFPQNSNTEAQQRYDYWEDLVTEALPWRSVPGMMDPMYIEAQAEDDIDANLPLVFGTISVVLVLLFANWIAPNLIGQSLFGAPSYIVPPSELNDIIRY